MAYSLPHKAAASAAPKRVIVKLGTGVLTSAKGELNTTRIAAVCSEIAALRARGTEVLVVSSGAVGLGMNALGLTKRRRTSRKNRPAPPSVSRASCRRGRRASRRIG